MRVEIARLHKEIGATMVYVTHDQVEAMTLADKIVVLRAGKIEQVGAPMDLYKDPDNRFVAGFIGSPAMNFLEGTVSGSTVRLPALNGREVPTGVTLRAEGKQVLVGLRPQHLKVVEGGQGLTLDIRERLGSVAYDHLITPGDGKLIVETRGDETIPEGSEVGLEFDADDALFFDGETEARLR